MATLTKASRVLASSNRGHARIPALPLHKVRPARSVVARSQNSSNNSEDPSVKLQQQLNDAVDFVKDKWDKTEDAEKPAAIAIIIGAIVAQIVIGATVDAVERLPFIHQFLEFVGLAVVSVYGYRYITDPVEREQVKKNIENFISAVTGSKTSL